MGGGQWTAKPPPVHGKAPQPRAPPSPRCPQFQGREVCWSQTWQGGGDLGPLRVSNKKVGVLFADRHLMDTRTQTFVFSAGDPGAPRGVPVFGTSVLALIPGARYRENRNQPWDTVRCLGSSSKGLWVSIPAPAPPRVSDQGA